MWIIYFILLSILVLGLAPFNSFGINIEWLNYHVEISLSFFIISILLLLLLMIFIVYVFFLVKNIPKSLRRYFTEKQLHNDTILLLEGFSAIYQQEPSKAKSILKRINCEHEQIKLLKPIFLLLSAKCNEMNNNESALEDIYQELQNIEGYKIVALKGLIMVRMRNKRYYDALIYAEKALSIESKLSWLLENLTIIYMELGFYSKSEQIIKKSLKYNFLGKEEANIKLVKTYIAYANQLINHSNSENAITMLDNALKLDPSNYNAVATLSGIYAQNNIKEAYKILFKAWKNAPSLYLANNMLSLYPDYNVNKKIKLLEKLIDQAPESKEGYLSLAELYISESMLPNARITIDKLLTLHAPDQYTSKLMAIIEVKSQSNHSTIPYWLNKL